MTAVFALVLPASAVSATTVTGTLVELHGHRADGSETASSYAIHAGERDRPLTDAHQPRSLIGQRVRVTDRAVAPGLQGRARAADEQRVAAAPGSGSRSLLVILFTTPDATEPSATADEARAAVFTGAASTHALYEQQSAGGTRFVGRLRDDGDVVGPLPISVPVAGCEYGAMATAADAAARSAGWEPSAYDHILYALPGNSSCDWGGLGQLPGRRLWINGALSTGVVAHELGHNLGAHHASSSRCTDGGVAVALSASCATSEYGDPFDVMGLSAVLMSSWHRAQVGQLPAAQQLVVREPQTVSLVSADDFVSPGPRLVLIPRKDPGAGVTRWFALELRSSRPPFDVWTLGAPVTTGISVRIVPDVTSTTQSQLLDARPSTNTRYDAPLRSGETLRDQVHGITITAGTIGGGTATVAVMMSTFADDVPPTSPRNLASSGNTNAATLTWSAATDDDAVAHYEIERDAAIVGATHGLSFSDTRVADLPTTTYRVIAVDRSGNRGASEPLRVSLPDATPPGRVPRLAAKTSKARVALSWPAAQDNRAVHSYRIVRDGEFLEQVSQRTYADRPGAGPHRYEVSAVDAAGNRGGPAATKVAVARKPQRVLGRWSWDGRVITMRVRASGATSVRAYSAGRRIARAKGSRLTVRLRVSRNAMRRTVRVVASSAGGTSARKWTMRRGGAGRR